MKREDRHVYYLRREDGALYELGRRVRRWRPILGGGEITRIDPTVSSTRIAARLEAVSLAGGWTPDDGERGLYRQGRTPDGRSAYLVAVVEDIRRWSNGTAGVFRFIDERALASAGIETAAQFDRAITGSRYAVDAKPMIVEGSRGSREYPAVLARIVEHDPG